MRKSRIYSSLPYNPQLRDRAKELRKAGNLSEVLIWQQLHKRKFKGYDFDRQKIIGNYIVDFFCIDCRTVIEIDGCTHNEKAEYDRERTVFLESLGLRVIRIQAVDVLNHLNEVMIMLENHPALNHPAATRHPSKGGE